MEGKGEYAKSKDGLMEGRRNKEKQGSEGGEVN